MLVGVAAGTLLRDSDISMVQINHSNVLALSGRYMTGRVAAVAGDFGVLTFESVPCLPVIEVVMGRFPFDDVELSPQVLGMATDAVLIACQVLGYSGVEAPLVCQPQSDFGVATKTFKLSLAQPEAMAGVAVGVALKTLVGMRERSRGDLCLDR